MLRKASAMLGAATMAAASFKGGWRISVLEDNEIARAAVERLRRSHRAQSRLLSATIRQPTRRLRTASAAGSGPAGSGSVKASMSGCSSRNSAACVIWA